MSARSNIEEFLHRGYLVCDQPQCEDSFVRSLFDVGTVIAHYDVTVIRGANVPTLNTHHPMEFHSDAPCADYVAWYCLRAGNPNEFLLLSDILKITQGLNDEERRVLAATDSRLPEWYKPASALLQSYEHFPLLTYSSGWPKLNYTPWIIYESDGEPHSRKIVGEFLNAIRAAISQPVHIALTEGQAVIINNGRIVHSRTLLSRESKRFHRRYWLKRRSSC